MGRKARGLHLRHLEGVQTRLHKVEFVFIAILNTQSPYQAAPES